MHALTLSQPSQQPKSHIIFEMAPKGKAAEKGNASKDKGKGKATEKEDGGKVKGAQQINVRHILVKQLLRTDDKAI